MQSYLGLARLMRLALSGENLIPLCQSLLQQAADDPNESCALLDAAVIFQFLGDPETALRLQNEALILRRHYWLPPTQTQTQTQPPKLRLLALMAPGAIMANVPVECLLEDSDIALHLYYASRETADPQELPEHDVLFVAIGESEANRALLDAWTPRLLDWPRPVLNDPRRIGRVARDTAYERLHTLPGLLVPPTRRLDRAGLVALANGASAREDLAFPLIVRPFDSHAGHDLNKVDTPAELLDALAGIPGDGFFVSPFVDYRGRDGLSRKYRVILIDGQPFACHMAISSHWMIHYLNAGMADSPEKRAEEAHFMRDFRQGFAIRHSGALSAIHRAIGLEYLGIDCAETQDGRLLIFEVDPAMVAHAMDPIDLYPYKPPTMRTLFAAFRDLLIATAERGQPGLRPLDDE